MLLWKWVVTPVEAEELPLLSVNAAVRSPANPEKDKQNIVGQMRPVVEQHQ